MNRRQWKKSEKKAAARLVAAYPDQYEFTPADGSETVSPPHAHAKWLLRQRRSRRHIREGAWNQSEPLRRMVIRSYAEPPKGTPVHWYCSGYETPEWDCRLPSDIEHEIECYRDFEPREFSVSAASNGAGSP